MGSRTETLYKYFRAASRRDYNMYIIEKFKKTPPKSSEEKNSLQYSKDTMEERNKEMDEIREKLYEIIYKDEKKLGCKYEVENLEWWASHWNAMFGAIPMELFRRKP